MKLKNIWEGIRKVTKPEKQVRDAERDDPYATIKHKTKTLGFRSMKAHNNRRRTRGRNIQYVTIGKHTKPIYHAAL